MSTALEHPKRFMAVLGFSFAVEGALYSAAAPILPVLAREFSLSDSVAGLVLSGYSAGLIVGSTLSVLVLRRLNSRDVAAAGLVTLAIATVLFAWAWSAPVLILSRVAGGIAAGAMWTACTTWLLSVWPEERRGAALGSSMSFAVFGTLAGPLIGTLAVRTGLRPPSALVAVLCLLAASAIFTMARPARAVQSPSSDRELTRASRRLAWLAGAVVVLAGAMIGLVNVAGPLVLTRRGGSDYLAGLVFLVAAVLSVVTGRPFGALIDRLGVRGPLMASLLGLAIFLPLVGVRTSVYATGCVVAVLLVASNYSFITTATMLTRAGEASGWSLHFATALVATIWGVGETVGAVLAGVGLELVGTIWTTSSGAVAVVGGLVAVATLTRNEAADTAMSDPGLLEPVGTPRAEDHM